MIPTSPMIRVWQVPGALWQLFRLAWATRFRLRGGYWRWRRETAFGSDPARLPDAAARREAILEYGRWVGRMRDAMRR